MTGWLRTDDGYCFVVPLVSPDLAPIMPHRKGALALKRSRARSQPETIIRLDTSIGDAARKFGFAVAGTVREWQDRVAHPLEGCSNVALAVSVAFAAPLLRFADEQTGGFHDFGPSTIGKSAADAAGESVYGRPSTAQGAGEPFGAGWAAASDVSIVALAQKRTDMPLFLDELGKAKSIKDKVVETIYTLTGGTPKLRADSQGNYRAQQGFLTLAFSTGEISLTTFLKNEGDTEGRKKRFVDVPALVGSKTALETVPHDMLGEVCGRIYTNTARLHGAVGQAWLHHLVDLDEAGIKAKLDQHRKAWLALPEIADLIHRDPKDDFVIRRFALLAAALRMAIEAELMPWSIESSDRAIVACCLRWAANKNSSITTLEEKAAEQKLREALLTERASNRLIELNKQAGKGNGIFVPAPEHAVMFEGLDVFKQAGTLSGFIKNDPTMGSRILLYPDAFRRLIAGCGLDYDALVGHLERTRLLLRVGTEKVQGKSERFYVIDGAITASPRH